jgi:predicted RNA-binding Zn-ribbon protein involved in translation (DUF1610 family)
MAMGKAIRAPEKLFIAVMWIVSIIFGGFLIGLGNLVLGDLPELDSDLSVEQFIDKAGLAKLRSQQDDNQAKLDAISPQMEAARLKLEQAQSASQTGQETFDAWIKTRTATTNADQDPEVLARTRQLEELKGKERAAQEAIDALNNQSLPLQQARDTLENQQQALNDAAYPAFEKAMFWQELKVFAWRLMFTLPLLLIAGWLILKKRQSDYWPLMRGFVLAAAFAFFVELVPYLPSYGGYIRYIVGIVLTAIAGHYLIKNMRSYLARRQEVEVQNEEERRKLVSHEEAFKKIAAKTCPGCDRPIATTADAEANFCVHCGMTLYNRCTGCNTRKMAFFQYCMTCGTTAVETVKAAVTGKGAARKSAQP